MSKRSVLFLSGGMLFLGMAIGAGFLSVPLNQALHAVELLQSAESEADLPKDFSPLHQSSVWLAKVANVVTPSVVHIESERSNGTRGKIEETGSGVVVTSDKTQGFFVVTNRHVVEGASLEKIAVKFHDGRSLQPERVWDDMATDIAVLKIPADDLTAAEWGDSNRVDIGHFVLAMGSPFGLSRSVTLGIISAKGRRSLKLGTGSDVINQDFLQTDAAINPGNSGGPLIDMHGRIIGINTAIASQGGGNEGIGFSIPSNLAHHVMEQLLESGEVRRALLGVRLDPSFEIKTARRLRLDKVNGTRIVEVYKNSPASRANLQVDDVIMNFDGLDVQDEAHLINLVSLTPVGKVIRLYVWREGKMVTITVTLADRQALDQSSEAPPKSGLGYPVQQMGLKVTPLNPDHESNSADGEPSGLRVVDVDEQSSLADDLHTEDILQAVGRKPVASLTDLESALEQVADREAVLLKVRRAGATPKTEIVVWYR